MIKIILSAFTVFRNEQCSIVTTLKFFLAVLGLIRCTRNNLAKYIGQMYHYSTEIKEITMDQPCVQEAVKSHFILVVAEMLNHRT
jgi:hypothetical protein